MTKIVNVPEVELQIVKEEVKQTEDDKIMDLLKRLDNKIDGAIKYKKLKHDKTN
jgi:hypothetical protein